MSTVYTLSGVVAAVKAPYVQSNGREHRDLVVENEVECTPPRTQPVVVGFSGRRVALLDGLRIGDRVTVSFGISGRVVVGRDSVPRHVVSLYGLGLTVEPPHP